jgi:hypothetical protein
MLVKDELLSNITKMLSILKYYVEGKNINKLYDVNVISEDFFKELLNLIYQYDLENLNDTKANYPCIDLGDKIEKIAFQVTSENDRSKIQETIDKFIGLKLFNKFNELNVIIIGNKKNYQKEFETSGLFEFSIEDNVIDINDLLKVIKKVKTDKMEQISNFLKNEIRAEEQSESTLLMKSKSSGKKPQNLKKINRVLGWNHNEKELSGSLNDFLILYSTLEKIPKITRQFLSVIIDQQEDDCVLADKIKYLLGESVDYIKSHIQILSEKKLASIDDDFDGCWYIYLTNGRIGWSILNEIKEFSESSELHLDNIIVDLNFTVFDE